MIPVIIYGNEVSIFVEIKLVGISDAVGKHLKIAAIGIHSEDGSRIGIFVTIALLIGEIGAHVSDSPVNSSVRADNQARHSMAAKADMHVESVNKGLHFINDTVAVGIHDAHQDPTYDPKPIHAMLQDATSDVR